MAIDDSDMLDGVRPEGSGEPMFSVVMPTRNRPALFREALTSVLAQQGALFEVVVVDDGSADMHAQAYAAVKRELGGSAPVTFLHLKQTETGHGVSHALNVGARHASGRFLCFLDDDDTWTDTGHLARAAAVAQLAPDAELLLFDQAAFRGNERVTQPIWIEDLGVRLRKQPATVGPAYRVAVEELLTATGFSHMNTFIVGKALFQHLAGFDEGLMWESDRDIYLRAIDQARAVVYCPKTVSRHNVPDPRRTANITTRISAVERHLDQVRLLHRIATTARHGGIRDYARRHRRYALQKAWATAGTWGNRWRVGSTVARALWRRR